MDTYVELVAEVVSARRDEIEAALENARAARSRAAADLEEAERRVASFEYLLSLGDSPSPDDDSVHLTLHEAMRSVLQSTPGRQMPAGDLAREIDRRGLYKMRNGRPVEAQQIHARVGNYGHMFDRDSSGIRLI